MQGSTSVDGGGGTQAVQPAFPAVDQRKVAQPFELMHDNIHFMKIVLRSEITGTGYN